jgi:hypothetical protein
MTGKIEVIEGLTNLGRSRDNRPLREGIADMPIAMQEFGEVVGALRAIATDKKPGAERRTTQRIHVQAPLEIVPLVDPPPTPAIVRVITLDISPESLGMMTGKWMAIGDTFAAILPRGGKPPHMAIYAVARVHTVADGVYSIGSKLQSDSAPDVLSAVDPIVEVKLEPLKAALRKVKV